VISRVLWSSSSARATSCARCAGCVWRDHLRIIDVNHDYFEVQGIGYPDADVVALLQNLNTTYNPETVHNDTEAEYKEFATGKCDPWAYHRVM
jgi:hypothetical protein